MEKERWLTSCVCPTSWRGGMPLGRMSERRRYEKRTFLFCLSRAATCYWTWGSFINLSVIFRPMTLKISRGFWPARSLMSSLSLERTGNLLGFFFRIYDKASCWIFKRFHDGFEICTVHRDAQMIMEDMKRTISELEQESSLPAVGVELVDNELATLYMNSKKSEVNTIPAVHRHHQRIHCSNRLQ